MTAVARILDIDLGEAGVWRRAAADTGWRIPGCSIGDLGGIGCFKAEGVDRTAPAIMALAAVHGLLTFIAHGTFILSRQTRLRMAFTTAIGMSLIPFVSMAAAMNISGVMLTNSAVLTWWVPPIMLPAGFATAPPYNHCQLNVFGRACLE